MTEPPTNKAKVIEAYSFGGKSNQDMWVALANGCGKTLKSIKDFKGPTIDSIEGKETARLLVPSLEDGIIKLDRVPRTSPPELVKNFRAGLRSVAMNQYLKNALDHTNDIFLGEPGLPLFLRGPGGVGKTTGLVAIAQQIQAKGYLCAFIQLKDFTKCSPQSCVSGWADNCLQDCRKDFKDDEYNPWKHIAVSTSRLPGVSCFDLLEFLSTALEDEEYLFGLQQLFKGLVSEKKLPIAICLDQWNALERDYWTDGMRYYTRESHPLVRIFGSWEHVSRIVVFKALSSSCRADIPRASDGNGGICEYTVKVWPEHKCLWLLQMIRESRQIACEEADCRVADCSQKHVANPLTINEKTEIARLCGFLPREMIRYLVYSDGTKASYLRDAISHFKIRVGGLMAKDSEDALKFSALVYMHHADWNAMPSAWSVAGVMHEVSKGQWEWVCEAAKSGFFDAFRDSSDHFSGALAALRLYSLSGPTHGHALELAMIHHFNRYRKFSPGVSYTDLKGNKPTGVVASLSFEFTRLEFIKKEDRGKVESLVEGTAYILWEGAAVVDFFIYSSASSYAWIQVSKSKYSTHSTKAEDMFLPTAKYPVNTGAKPRHHSPYSYFRNLINSNPKRGTGFEEGEYYFYVTPNKPNPQRELSAVEMNNCFLVSGDRFEKLLGHEISLAIKEVLLLEG